MAVLVIMALMSLASAVPYPQPVAQPSGAILVAPGLSGVVSTGWGHGVILG